MLLCLVTIQRTLIWTSVEGPGVDLFFGHGPQVGFGRFLGGVRFHNRGVLRQRLKSWKVLDVHIDVSRVARYLPPEHGGTCRERLQIFVVVCCDQTPTIIPGIFRNFFVLLCNHSPSQGDARHLRASRAFKCKPSLVPTRDLLRPPVLMWHVNLECVYVLPPQGGAGPFCTGAGISSYMRLAHTFLSLPS